MTSEDQILLRDARQIGQQVAAHIAQEVGVSNVQVLDGPKQGNYPIWTTTVMFDYQETIRLYFHLDDGDAFLSSSITWGDIEHTIAHSMSYDLPDHWRALVSD